MASRLMVATTAIHQLGDISRAEPDFCWVFDDKETETDYVGVWVVGLGFCDVKFPKATTREPTDVERADFESRRTTIIGVPIG